MAEAMRPKLEAVTVELHSRLRHIPGYEIEDNKVVIIILCSILYSYVITRYAVLAVVPPNISVVV